MPFSTVFQLYCGSQCTYPSFPGVLLASTLHKRYSFQATGCFPAFSFFEPTGSSAREMNPFTMTVIKPWKEYCQDRDQTSDLLFSNQQFYQQLWGSAHLFQSIKAQDGVVMEDICDYFTFPIISVPRSPESGSLSDILYARNKPWRGVIIPGTYVSEYYFIRGLSNSQQ